MEYKIHKRICTCETILGAIARCGLLEFYIEEKNLNWRWKKVTCKNCLKMKSSHNNRYLNSGEDNGNKN